MTVRSHKGPRTLRDVILLMGSALVIVVLILIGIPFYLRREIRRHDTGALECVRAVRDWQKAFSEVNGGLFATPLCILRPLACGANAPAGSMTTPACLTASVSDNAEAVRYKTIPGYRGRLLTTAGASALSSTYLFALEPNVAGKDGTQRIGVDETGRICVVGAFREPRTLLDHSGLLRTDCDSTQ